jgi:hypothetical protein
VLRRVISRLFRQTAENTPACDRFQFPLILGQEVESLLHAIPSQTTKGERRFLFTFFESIWSGVGDVVEIGPFLGGTSRCIALGMLANPHDQKLGKLYTYDRFQDYFNLADLKTYLAPRLSNSPHLRDELDGLGENARFREIFDIFHKGNDYFNLIVPSDNGVPDLREQVDGSAWMEIPNTCDVSAVFVDGCKSWYGTKYFMQLMAEHVKPGCFFIFQDYGWYTCFWLAAFVEIFRDHFSLIGSVDHTYAFKLKRELSKKDIERVYPDAPSGIGAEGFVSLFNDVIKRADLRNDTFAVVRHRIHKAAAIAYLGDVAQAKRMLVELREDPLAKSSRHIINKALKSPTYRPDGPVYL